MSAFDPNKIPRLVSDGVLLDECRAELAAAQADFDKRLSDAEIAHQAEVAELRADRDRQMQRGDDYYSEWQAAESRACSLSSDLAAASITPAERAVLEGMRDVSLELLHMMIDHEHQCWAPELEPVALAELTRRATREQPAGECKYVGRCNSTRCKACNPEPAPVSGAKVSDE